MVHTIWSGGKSALLFATAKPPRSGRILIFEFCFYSFTSATVGGLTTAFYGNGERLRTCRKTNSVCSHCASTRQRRLSSCHHGNKHQGGRGYAYEICASYKVPGSKLKRFDLNSRSGIPLRRWMQF